MIDKNNLQPNPDNPRTISEEAFNKLKAKISRNPDGLRLQKIGHKDGIIIAGNQRYRAIKDLGLDIKDEWLADLTGWTDEQIKEWLVTTNVSDGEWDFDLLANQYDMLELEELGVELPDYLADNDEVVEDEAPEADESEPPKSKLGEIYQLGRHRVMCGSATAKEDATSLVGSSVDSIITDPPYGMNAFSKSGVLSKTYGTDIMGDDDIDTAKDSFMLAQELYPEAKQFWWGANYYSEILPSSECWIVWNKNNGGSDQTDAELAWSNSRSVVRMFTQSSEKINRVHPTQKPVELSVWIIKKFDVGKIVLDLFLGSGSTLIACEQTDRTCYGMELDPKYVDVIRKRYAKYMQPESWEDEWELLTHAIENEQKQ